MAIRAALNVMYYIGTHLVTRPLFGGMGAILMFHRVRHPIDSPFQPNRFLEITPEFLEEIAVGLRQRGVEIVSLDEVCRRIATGASDDRFVALTFDDAYRDNLEYAWPIPRHEEAPFTIFVASDFADGGGHLWWLALEAVIASNESVALTIGGSELTDDCPTKYKTYQTILKILSGTVGGTRDAIAEMSLRYEFDFAKQCRAECMDWNELNIRESSLTTIGIHTVTHPILLHLSAQDAKRETSIATRRIAKKVDVNPVHLAYPHGGPDDAGTREFTNAAELGFRSAATTRPGVPFAEHADHMTALPRVTINGEFQQMRYLDVLLSGTPATPKNRFRLANAA